MKQIWNYLWGIPFFILCIPYIVWGLTYETIRDKYFCHCGHRHHGGMYCLKCGCGMPEYKDQLFEARRNFVKGPCHTHVVGGPWLYCINGRTVSKEEWLGKVQEHGED